MKLKALSWVQAAAVNPVLNPPPEEPQEQQMQPPRPPPYRDAPALRPYTEDFSSCFGNVQRTAPVTPGPRPPVPDNRRGVTLHMPLALLIMADRVSCSNHLLHGHRMGISCSKGCCWLMWVGRAAADEALHCRGGGFADIYAYQDDMSDAEMAQLVAALEESERTHTQELEARQAMRVSLSLL